MDEYVSQIRECMKGKGIHIQYTTPDGNDFYKIISDEMNGGISQFKTRKLICELEKKYSFYFQLFLPIKNQGAIVQTTPFENLIDDLKLVLNKREPPSPRELYAASEILRRQIYVLEIKDFEDNMSSSWSGYVYSPILRSGEESIKPLFLCMLRTRRKPNFVKMHADREYEIMDLFSESVVNTGHINCIGNRFLNTFEALHDQEATRENCNNTDFFSTLSSEVYGSNNYTGLVMTLIFRYQIEDSHVEIFSKFLDDTQNMSFKAKKQSLLRHQDNIKEDIESPGQAEIFAAVSVFNIQIFLDRPLSSETEFYLPLSGCYSQDFESYLLLKQGDSIVFSCSDFTDGLCSCLREKPNVHGKLSLLKNSIYSHLAFGNEWSSVDSGDERHKTANHSKSSGTNTQHGKDEHEIPVFQPYSEIGLVMRRRDMTNRIVERLNGYDFSLWRCISKEIFESEDKYKYVMKEVYKSVAENPQWTGQDQYVVNQKSPFVDLVRRRKSSAEKEETIGLVTGQADDDISLEELELKTIATYFQTKIYVLKIEDDNTTRWRLYKPNERETIPSALGIAISNRCPEHEFYVTLYKSTTGQFHRVVPTTEQCNCGLRAPRDELNLDPLCDLPINESRLIKSAVQTDNAFGQVHRILREWLLCSRTLQQLCDSLAAEIEERRFKVNIATITGSSVGLVGACVAIGGLIAAPFTMGVSTSLLIAGGVVAGLGGVTATGAKIGESVLNVDSMKNLQRSKLYFEECSSRLEESVDRLVVNVEDFDDAINNFRLSNSLHTFDKSGLQSIPGVLQAIKGFAVIPIAIMRFAVRMATILGAIIGPLSAVLDIGFMAFSVWNMRQGCNTDLSDSLRRTSAFLVASRKQMHSWAFGNEIDETF